MKKSIFSLVLMASSCQPAMAQVFYSPPKDYVKSVQSVMPDANGNVSGIATSSQLNTIMIAGDVISPVTPTTGSTVTPPVGTTVLLINNATLLAALTINMPVSPADGQRFVVSSAAGVTLLSFSGATVRGGLSLLSVNGYARFIYSTAVGAWFRVG